MQALKAIIFDMDGTLADTEEIHRQAFNAAFEEFEIPRQWSQVEYKRLLSISGGRERLRQFLKNNLTTRAWPGSAAELAVKIHRRKSEIYRQRLVDGHIGLRPGVERLIREAADKGIALAIATSSSSRNAETLIKVSLGEDALGLFRAVVTCDIVEEKKPSPAVYLEALRRLKLAPGECVAIEDTHNGNLAALSAGIATIITTHLFTLDDDFDGASLVLDRLGEPGEPATVIAGDTYGSAYVDLALIDVIISENLCLGASLDTAVAAE